MHDRRPLHRSHRRTTRRAASTAVCLALLATACGDDGDGDGADTADDESVDVTSTTAASEGTDADDAADAGSVTATTVGSVDTAATTDPPATETTTGPVATDAVAASATAACTTFYAINDAMSGNGDPSTVPALFDELEQAAPADIDGELDVVITTARVVVDGGMQDWSPLETPEFRDAFSTVDTWMFENCDFDNRVTVAAVDFAYEGVANEYPSGTTAFRVTNNGTEAHEMVLIRRNDDATVSWDELLALPEAEAMTMAMPVASVWVGEPGARETLVADLTPGDYIAICFIPAGTTAGPGGQFTEGTGEPHFMFGMRAEFTVR